MSKPRGPYARGVDVTLLGSGIKVRRATGALPGMGVVSEGTKSPPTSVGDVVKLRGGAGSVGSTPTPYTTRSDLAMQSYLTLPDGTVRIPLHDRYGSIVAYASVDAADAEWAGQWQWKFSPNERHAYAYRTDKVDGKHLNISMHRALLGLEYGDEREGDHRDRDRLNNRRGNLRVLPKGANSQNKSSHKGSSSQFRGVAWNKRARKWQAYVYAGGKLVRLGMFADETEAGEAARQGRSRLMPYAVD